MESLERNALNIDLIPTTKMLSIMGRQGDSLCTLSNVIYEKAIAMTGNGILPAKAHTGLSLPENQYIFLNGIYHYQLIFLFPLSTPGSWLAGESFNVV